jgi:hypothetical protein
MLSSTDDEALLRHRLLQLDYHEQFTSESVPLIQRLLADLIQTTDSARKFKTQAERMQQEKAAYEEQVMSSLSSLTGVMLYSNVTQACTKEWLSYD